MGIPKLNKYLIENCNSKCICKTHISKLKGKKLAIDTSIYLYKFISRGELLEDMYLFISILLSYNITPVFIFDGKPPPEKKEILIKRNNDKKKAEEECRILNDKLKDDLTYNEKMEIEDNIEILKKKCIRVKNIDISSVKKLLAAYGITYLEAINEADELCGYLMTNNLVDGCISDDMDMFMYGCKYIIRHFSLLNHTMIMYDYNEICKCLKINNEDMKKILILSGTDYNIHMNNNIYEIFKLYKEYKKKNEGDFYSYVDEKKKIKIDDLKNIEKLFECSNYLNDEYKKSDFTLKERNDKYIKEILTPEGFYWV